MDTTESPNGNSGPDVLADCPWCAGALLVAEEFAACSGCAVVVPLAPEPAPTLAAAA